MESPKPKKSISVEADVHETLTQLQLELSVTEKRKLSASDALRILLEIASESISDEKNYQENLDRALSTLAHSRHKNGADSDQFKEDLRIACIPFGSNAYRKERDIMANLDNYKIVKSMNTSTGESWEDPEFTKALAEEKVN